MGFQSNVAECTRAMNEGAVKALLAACNVGRNQVVQNISGARSGIVYLVPGTKTAYTASAPGEYPAVATGRLRGDVKTLIEGDIGYVGTELDYGLYLEKKDPQHGGREWLRPSLEQAKPDIIAELNKRWF
jgi:hypothetical protein